MRSREIRTHAVSAVLATLAAAAACAPGGPARGRAEIVTSRAAIAPPAPQPDVALSATKAQVARPTALTFSDKLDVDALRGRVVVMHFWATWCEPCKKSLPEMQALADRHPPADLAVVAVSVDDESDGVGEFAALHGVKLTVVWDRDSALAKRMMPSTMPSTFVLDRNGALRATHSGYPAGVDVAIDRDVRRLF